MTTPFRRLHPASLLFGALSVLRGFLLPAVVVVVLGRGRGGELWLALLALPAAVAAVVRYLSYSFALGDDELVIREGVFHRKERHIPYQRIQSLDTTRGPLHRLLGVADLSVQTASGAEAEAVMRVLSLAAIEAMRRHVFERRAALAQDVSDKGKPAVGVAADHAVVARASTADLVRLGLIANRGMVALAAVTGVVWQLDLVPDEAELLRRLGEQLPGVELGLPLHAAMVITVTLAAAFVLLRLLSVGWSLVSLHGFELARHDDELRTRFGLLTQRTLTIPRHRIQLVEIEQGVLHRLLGRHSVRARTAGAVAQDQSGAGRDWLHPVADARTLVEVLAAARDDLELAAVRWRPVAAGAAARRARVLSARALAVLAAIALTLDPRLLLLTPLVVAGAVFVARRQIALLGWAVTPTAVWLRWGWLRRRIRAVPVSKVQSTAVAESPFDRRRGMATLELDTANAGMMGAAIRIPYLERELAGELWADLAERAARTRFRW